MAFSSTLDDYELRHLVWHLIWAKREIAQIADLLTALDFLETKANRGMAFELADDFFLAASYIPETNPVRIDLDYLESALCRNIHFIASHPDTLFQCLYNYCVDLVPTHSDATALHSEWRVLGTLPVDQVNRQSQRPPQQEPTKTTLGAILRFASQFLLLAAYLITNALLVLISGLLFIVALIRGRVLPRCSSPGWLTSLQSEFEGHLGVDVFLTSLDLLWSGDISLPSVANSHDRPAISNTSMRQLMNKWKATKLESNDGSWLRELRTPGMSFSFGPDLDIPSPGTLMAVSSIGPAVATFDETRSHIAVWQGHNGRRTIHLPFANSCRCALFSKQGTALITCSGADLCICDLSANYAVRLLISFQSEILCAASSDVDNTTHVALGLRDGSLVVGAILDGVWVENCSGRSEAIAHCISWHSSTRRIVTAHADNTITIWSITGDRLIALSSMTAHDRIKVVRFAASDRVTIGLNDGGVVLWDGSESLALFTTSLPERQQRKFLGVSFGPERRVRDYLFDASSDYVVRVSTDDEWEHAVALHVIDVNRHRWREYPFGRFDIKRILLNQHGHNAFLGVERDRHVWMFDFCKMLRAQHPTTSSSTELQFGCDAIAVSRDGRYVAALDAVADSVYLFSGRDGTLRHRLRHKWPNLDYGESYSGLPSDRTTLDRYQYFDEIGFSKCGTKVIAQGEYMSRESWDCVTGKSQWRSYELDRGTASARQRLVPELAVEPYTRLHCIAHNGAKDLYFPVALSQICCDQEACLWAGIAGRDVYILRVEGPVANGSTKGLRSHHGLLVKTRGMLS